MVELCKIAYLTDGIIGVYRGSVVDKHDDDAQTDYVEGLSTNGNAAAIEYQDDKAERRHARKGGDGDWTRKKM